MYLLSIILSIALGNSKHIQLPVKTDFSLLITYVYNLECRLRGNMIFRNVGYVGINRFNDLGLSRWDSKTQHSVFRANALTDCATAAANKYAKTYICPQYVSKCSVELPARYISQQLVRYFQLNTATYLIYLTCNSRQTLASIIVVLALCFVYSINIC